MSRTRRTLRLTISILGVATLLAVGLALGAAPGSSRAVVPCCSISGTVTLAQSGTSATLPGSNVLVYLVDEKGDDSNAISGDEDVSDAYTGSDGTYSFSGDIVPNSSYELFFQDNDSNASEWLGGTAYQRQSTIVQVGTTAVTGQDITLPVGATVSGTITSTASTAPDPYHEAAELYAIDPTTGQAELYGFPWEELPTPGAFAITNVAVGTYILKFGDLAFWDEPELGSQYWNSEDGVEDADLITVTSPGQVLTGYDGTVGDPQFNVGRISGANRFETAIAISQAAYPSDETQPDVVFVANGDDYPDALSAGAAAAHEGGPLLLVEPTELPAEVATEIRRLGSPPIVVVGGTASVDDSVYAQLSAIVGGAHIQRQSGPDRYATSRAIAAADFPDYHGTAFVATGTGYPDALVAGNAAGYVGGPLILVDGDASSVDSPTAALLTSLHVSQVYVAGGTGVVTAGLETSIGLVPGVDGVQRLAGQDRYETAQAVDNAVFRVADSAFFATGDGFADALSGSAVLGVSGIPLYLSTMDCIDNGELLNSEQLGASSYVDLGGTGVLDNNVENLNDCSDETGSASARVTAPVDQLNSVSIPDSVPGFSSKP